MDAKAGNGDSDYDSDFTADEERILNDLLLQLPNEHTVAPSLAVKETDDDEASESVHMPRTLLGRERREHPKSQNSQVLVTPPQTPISIEIQDNSGGHTHGILSYANSLS